MRSALATTRRRRFQRALGARFASLRAVSLLSALSLLAALSLLSLLARSVSWWVMGAVVRAAALQRARRRALHL